MTALPPANLPPATVPPANVPVMAVPDRLDRNPAAVYLAGKASAVGRRGLQRSLDRAAEILTGGLSTRAPSPSIGSRSGISTWPGDARDS